MRWMHRVRLYPKPSQIVRLIFALDVTRQLYNAMLEQRREAFLRRGIGITAKMQYAELTALRAEDARIAAVYRECQDAVLHRLDLAFQAFFRRIKAGDTPGYPRFKPAARWKQLEYPHGDRALKLNDDQTKVRIPGIGTMALRKGREIPDYGRAFIVERNGRWYAVFESSREVQPLPPAPAVGVDMGVADIAALSTGERFANPRHADRLRARVELHQHGLESASVRDSRGRVLNRQDPARKKAVLRLARAKEREANARRDTLHKVSHTTVQRFGTIVLENLKPKNMTRSAAGTVDEPGTNVAAKSGLNRRLLDAALGTLRQLIVGKAAYAARTVIFVDAKYTSQTCSVCRAVASASRDGKRFRCIHCHFEEDSDVNAARVILERAQLAPTSEPSPGAKPGRRATSRAA